MSASASLNGVTERWEIWQGAAMIAEAQTQWAAGQVVAVANANPPSSYVEPVVTVFVAPSQASIEAATGSGESLPI